MCKSEGFRLIHVFEDEWRFNKEIVKSRLSNMFGVYSNTVYARKCKVKEVDGKTSGEFVTSCHIQGKCRSSLSLGLYYGDELVSLMTFGKPRFNKKYEWELLRFCNKLGHHVIGGAGKLLKYFERNYSPKSLISYADRRWSDGNLYEKLGFEMCGVSRPNYWYLDKYYEKRYSRMLFQKHKLKNILESYSDSKTEYENMLYNGYHRIYDCGNIVFIKKYKKDQI